MCSQNEMTVPFHPLLRATLAWASVSQVASTTLMSLMTLASLLPRSFLVEQLPWMGGWGEMAWKQGCGWKGQDGDEEQGQDDPSIIPEKEKERERRKGETRRGRRQET